MEKGKDTSKTSTLMDQGVQLYISDIRAASTYFPKSGLQRIHFENIEPGTCCNQLHIYNLEYRQGSKTNITTEWTVSSAHHEPAFLPVLC